MTARLPIRRQRGPAPLRSRLGLTRLEDRLTPSFTAPVNYPAAAQAYSPMLSADFNRDGNLDLMLGNAFGGPAHLLLGNSNGTFQSERSINTSVGALSIAVADFNNDGNPDLAACGGTTAILLGNGDGHFQSPIPVPFGVVTDFGISTADFNRDGKMDLAISGYFDPYTDTSVEVFLGHGDGTFAQSWVGWVSVGGADLVSLAVGDFNNDGALDITELVEGNGFGWLGNTLLGRGDGTFSNVDFGSDVFFLPSAVSAYVRATDLNSDGRLDFLAADTFAFGTGDGTFGALHSIGVSATSSVSGDVNGDTIPDLIATGDSLKVLLGSGNGAFGPAQPFGGGYSSHDLVAGDFNHDGLLDGALADHGSGNVVVFVNTGNWVSQPTVTISDASVIEGQSGTSTINFTVTLSAASSQPVTVQFNTQDNYSATAGSDYTATSGTMTFSPGQISKTITVNVAGDTAPESNETFLVQLHDPAGALVSDGSATGTIINDDFTLAINDVSITEGNTGSQSATFTVTLSGTSTQTVSVQFLTANGTATSGSDFQSTGGTVTFAPGQTSKTFTVGVLGDRLPEANETFVVNLSNPTNAAIADGQGACTIIDNEPRISIGGVSMTEGNSGTKNFTFTVTLSAAYDQAVTMSFRTLNGTATTGNNDYFAKSGSLTFEAGQTSKTITIQVRGDKKKESNETFQVELFDLSSNALFTDSLGLGTILNDD